MPTMPSSVRIREEEASRSDVCCHDCSFKAEGSKLDRSRKETDRGPGNLLQLWPRSVRAVRTVSLARRSRRVRAGNENAVTVARCCGSHSPISGK